MPTLNQLEQRIHEETYYLHSWGADPALIAAKRQLMVRVLETFRAHYDASGDREVKAYFVPGRVEILGKHTDYAGGHSLLVAADRGFLCLSAANDSHEIRLVEEDPAYEPVSFPFTPDLFPPPGHWSNYPMTLAKRLAANFGQALPWRGVDIAFGCDLPVGGGMSGSSALMIMTFFALAGPNRLFENAVYQRNIRNDIDLAMYLACCENGQTFRELVGGAGVGTFGGSEDHTEILNGRAGFFSIFQFCPTVHKADVAFPPDLTLAIAYSGLKAEKTGEAMAPYNLVSRRAQRVVEHYNRRYGTAHRLLRDLITEQRSSDERTLMRRVEEALEGVPAEGEDAGLFLRFRQFHAEDQHLIPDAARALILDDLRLVGQLIDRSHRLSREMLGNIVPEIDFLQQQARELGAVAASGFGAGFGGSAYALVRQEEADSFLQKWEAAYAARFPAAQAQARFFLTRPAGRAAALFE
jgi:galactokinase